MDILTQRTSRRLAAKKAIETLKTIDHVDISSENESEDSPVKTESYSEELDAPSDPEDPVSVKRAKGREGNREQAKKTRLLRYWHQFWQEPELRHGSPYPTSQATLMIAKHKKIKCPQCPAVFSTRQGIQYHYKRCKIDLKTRCLICKMLFSTKGELLRHLCSNHYQDLPTLPDHALAGLEYLLEPQLNRKNTNTRSAAVSRNTLLSAKAFQFTHFLSDPEFTKWLPNKKDWSLIESGSALLEELPETVSPKFTTGDGRWLTLEVGDSIRVGDCNSQFRTLTDSSNDTIFYAGGSIWAADWCPIPNDFNRKPSCPSHSQYISIAVSCADMETTRSFADSNSESGYLQLWSLKCSDEQGFMSESAKLEISIFHRFGCVWSMAWCPGGTSYQEPDINVQNDGQMPRLGLLALACADGSVRIISMPHVGSLKKDLKCKPIFIVQPVAELRPPGIGTSTDSHRILCRSISWNQISRGLFAAGYSNGMVSIFDLKTTSSLLVFNSGATQILKPVKVFLAHSMAVTSMSWLPCQDLKSLATGSTDRTVKVWNLDDLHSFLTLEKFPVTKLCCDHKHKGLVVAFDTAFNSSFINRVLTRRPTKNGWEGRSLSLHHGTVWDIDVSPITSSFASADSAGELLVLPIFSTSRLRRSKTGQAHSRHSVYRVIPCALENNDGENMSDLPKSPKPERESNDYNESEFESTESSGESEEPSSSEGINRSDGFATSINSVKARTSIQPKRFLLHHSHPPVESYSTFKKNFGIQFKESRLTPGSDQRTLRDSAETSCRAHDIGKLNCDRDCDYPYCSINKVLWNPNLKAFSLLFAATQVGLCRVSDLKLIIPTAEDE